MISLSTMMSPENVTPRLPAVGAANTRVAYRIEGDADTVVQR
jgi:hypothetical protein